MSESGFGGKKDGGEHGLVNSQLQFTTHNAAKLAQSKWGSGGGGFTPEKYGSTFLIVCQLNF